MLFGYHIPINFNLPFIAHNMADFWKRWHISLSTWLSDYLFIPIGGSRGTKRKVHYNLFLTMALGGLWHGASWNFVVWGIYHGLCLFVHQRIRRGEKQVDDIRPLLGVKVLSRFVRVADFQRGCCRLRILRHD